MDLEGTHYTAKHAFTTLVVFTITGPLLGHAPTFAERATLFVFAFFSLREFAVVPLLSLARLHRLRITRTRQLLNGIVHSAIAGGLSTLLVVAHQHREIDSVLQKQGEPLSEPPDYRAFAVTNSEVCAVVQLLANVHHVWRAGRRASDTGRALIDISSRSEAYRIQRKVILKRTVEAYLAVVIIVLIGGFVGSIVADFLASTPVFLLVPVFFWLRDYIIGPVLYALATPQPRLTTSTNRWTSKVFESTLAGAFVGVCTAALTSYMRTWTNNNGADPPTSLEVPAFATTGAHAAMVGQVLVNMWSCLWSTIPTTPNPSPPQPAGPLSGADQFQTRQEEPTKAPEGGLSPPVEITG